MLCPPAKAVIEYGQTRIEVEVESNGDLSVFGTTSERDVEYILEMLRNLGIID